MNTFLEASAQAIAAASAAVDEAEVELLAFQQYLAQVPGVAGFSESALSFRQTTYDRAVAEEERLRKQSVDRPYD